MTTFALSSAVFIHRALDERALAAVVEHGFDLVELVVAENHFDPLKDSQVERLRAALAATGANVCAIVAPVDRLDEVIDVAHSLACPLLVGRSFQCRQLKADAGAVDEALARRTIDRLIPPLSASGLNLALEFPAWRGMSPDGCREFVDSFEDLAIGAALDIGHAALAGQTVEAAEALSGFLASARVHDNNGRDDAHRLPGSGSIDWPGAITACWKTGFSGPWILAPAAETDEGPALARAVGARTRLQAILEDLSQPFAFTE